MFIQFNTLNYSREGGGGGREVIHVVGQLGVICKIIFCLESESRHRIGPSCEDFDI